MQTSPSLSSESERRKVLTDLEQMSVEAVAEFRQKEAWYHIQSLPRDEAEQARRHAEKVGKALAWALWQEKGWYRSFFRLWMNRFWGFVPAYLLLQVLQSDAGPLAALASAELWEAAVFISFLWLPIAALEGFFDLHAGKRAYEELSQEILAREDQGPAIG